MKIMKFITKVFTFLKEKNIILDIKTKLLEILKDEKDDILPKIEVYLKDNSPIIKENLCMFLLEKISLPFYLKPFKGIVKKVIYNNIDKLIKFIIEQTK